MTSTHKMYFNHYKTLCSVSVLEIMPDTHRCMYLSANYIFILNLVASNAGV